MPRIECRNSFGQFGRRHHFQKRSFGIGVGEHDAGANLGAVFQHDAARPAVADIDVRDRSGGADFNSQLSVPMLPGPG